MKLCHLLPQAVFILGWLLLVLHLSSCRPLKFKNVKEVAADHFKHFAVNFPTDYSIEQLSIKQNIYLSQQTNQSSLDLKASSLKEPHLQAMTCVFCKGIVYLVQFQVAKGSTHDQIAKIVTDACIYFQIEDQRVCIGIVNVFQDEVLTVLDKLALSPEEVCGVLVGKDCGDPYNPLSNWNITLPSAHKPPVGPHVLPKPGSPTLRVLHLTDIHLDTVYQPGSNAVCNEPLCCHADDGSPAPGTPGAGYYGDYRSCDTPPWTLEGLFSHLASEKDQFDYIMWTGDLPSHTVWNQTRTSQTSLLTSLTSLLLKYFPDKPIFPALGNHESAPVNSFPPNFVTGNQSAAWLYDALVDSWKHWLPEDTYSTIKQGGFYTVSPLPGFRIISINMNDCNDQNWWLLLNTTDPDDQLVWLAETLQFAEDKKEKVHIIGHIPPGVSDCLKAWSYNYYMIVDRYESTITGQFFGHTHFDHFEVFYDQVTLKRPTNVAYITPSVTPFSNLNMGYRIFIIDGNYTGSSWEVLDHLTFILNLTAANIRIGNEPKWQLEYTAKAAYDMKSVFPEDWDNLITNMKDNDTLLQTFNRYYYKSHAEGSCDDKCKKSLLCGLKSGRSYSPELCSDLGITSMQEFQRLMALKKVC